MKNAIATIAVAACLVACSKNRPAENVGTTTTVTRSTEVKPQAPAQQAKTARPDIDTDVYGTTTTTSGEEKGSMARSHEVRKHLQDKEPRSETIIRGLIITDDGEIVTISGIVPDEETHQALAKAARDTPNVKIKDEMKVHKKK